MKQHRTLKRTAGGLFFLLVMLLCSLALADVAINELINPPRGKIGRI